MLASRVRWSNSRTILPPQFNQTKKDRDVRSFCYLVETRRIELPTFALRMRKQTF